MERPAATEVQLRIWKMIPVANPDDSRWLGHKPVPALFVAADSPASARVVASKTDVPPPEGHVGNESGHAHSRFGDEKLYRVMEAGEDDLRELPPIPDKPAVIAKRDDDGALRPWPE